mgnify:CR=1 FL=1
MCIRASDAGVLEDPAPVLEGAPGEARIDVGAPPVDIGDRVARARRHQQPAFVAPAVAVGPVSYTHLRAHETVLDLVCRLLLEKKKKNKKQKSKKKKNND